MERRATQRAARRPLLPPRADGLDDAPPAAAGVAARPQLAVWRARQAHRARVPVVVVVRVRAAAAFTGTVVPSVRCTTNSMSAHGRVLMMFSRVSIRWC